MLSQRLARSAARASLTARCVPQVQRRTYIPSQFSDPKIIDEKYPDRPQTTEAEDPGMVSRTNEGRIGAN